MTLKYLRLRGKGHDMYESRRAENAVRLNCFSWQTCLVGTRVLNVDVWMGFKEFLVGAGRRCCMSMEGRVPVVIFLYKTFGVKQYDGTTDTFV
jgi:hypothetical protein